MMSTGILFPMNHVISDAPFETPDASRVLLCLSPVNPGTERNLIKMPVLCAERSRGTKMSDAYVVEVGGQTAGIVVRDSKAETFSFFAATRRFHPLEGREFAEPYAAERAARQLVESFGVLPLLSGAPVLDR
jgi:hypothetical protein